MNQQVDDRGREALLELALRVKNSRYRFFKPNGRGGEFVDAVGSMRYFITLFSAANGVGKTTTAVNVLANIIFPLPGGHPFFTGPLYQKFPYLKNIRIISDPHVVESIIKEMKIWFPKGRYVTTKGRKSYEAYWKTDTGFIIDIMTYDQDPKEFESANLGLIWFDEPPPQIIYKACIARLRRGGQIFITATPLAGSEWMYDEILINPNNLAGGRVFIEADVEAACKQHGIRGHLEHSNIEKIIAQYDENEKQARIYGKFQHLTGLVFKQFDQKIHLIKPFNVTPQDYAVYQQLDPHPRTPDAVSWIAVDRKGTKFVVDELFMKCANGDGELAWRIKEKDAQYRVVKRVCDPSAFIEDQHTGTSLAKRLQKMGLYYEEATKARAAADRRIGDALNYTLVGDHMLKAPELYIFNTCGRHIYEMLHYRWDEWTGRSATKHGAKQKPMDKDDHQIENLGRCLYSEPEFVPMQVEGDEDYTPVDDPYA